MRRCTPCRLARAVVRAAYRAGARYVDLILWDPHSKLARLQHAPEDSLSWTPPWMDARNEANLDTKAARIGILGDDEPDLYAGIDPERLNKDRMPRLASSSRIAMSNDVNWTLISAPSPGWAEQILGEPDVERLWELVARAVRLDEPDPVAAWRAHVDRLGARGRALTARAFDAIRFRGPGTDLTVGMLPGHLWLGGSDTTSWGRSSCPTSRRRRSSPPPTCAAPRAWSPAPARWRSPPAGSSRTWSCASRRAAASR